MRFPAALNPRKLGKNAGGWDEGKGMMGGFKKIGGLWVEVQVAGTT